MWDHRLKQQECSLYGSTSFPLCYVRVISLVWSGKLQQSVWGCVWPFGVFLGHFLLRVDSSSIDKRVCTLSYYTDLCCAWLVSLVSLLLSGRKWRQWMWWGREPAWDEKWWRWWYALGTCKSAVCWARGQLQGFLSSVTQEVSVYRNPGPSLGDIHRLAAEKVFSPSNLLQDVIILVSFEFSVLLLTSWINLSF